MLKRKQYTRATTYAATATPAEDNNIYADAGASATPPTGIAGGSVLEFTGHPFVKTKSQCLKLWICTANR